MNANGYNNVVDAGSIGGAYVESLYTGSAQDAADCMR